MPSVMTFEFLSHFKEETLLTPEGEYEEDYILEQIKEYVISTTGAPELDVDV